MFRLQPLAVRPAPRPLAPFFLLVTAWFASACGGPIAHRVKASEVPVQHRAELEPTSQAIDDALVTYQEAEHASDEAKKAWKKQKDVVTDKGHNIKIARAELKKQKAMEQAGKSGDVKTAKTKLEHAKKDETIAEAKEKLTQARYELADAEEALARAEWELALATHESAKAERARSSESLTKKRPKIDAQLASKREARDLAEEKREKAASRVEKAQDRLADASDH